ncbi:MAG: DNA-processing protein DprA [Phoenicibacter congonensis]|uniref:DNA-processing protein DprA n=1 Tax=Phoenicibacter congonensis TaxID=1944646 RepID=A0AA43RHR0_9ACTN|nr:DNA-processing protein DprA [Phoenicibacter congonensis]
MTAGKLEGERTVITRGSSLYPECLEHINQPPKRLFVLGNVEALQEGVAFVGARKATPYGLGCASRFAKLCAKNRVAVISGGALGCDCAAQRACVEEGGITVSFVPSINDVYPRQNFALFQQIVDCGGALVSENGWDVPCMPWMFRMRNRLIAGLAKATLICEAGIPSGTFSTADEALAANREVMVVPGSITSKNSRGSNRLIYQGATPIIDDETFVDELSRLFGCLQSKKIPSLPQGVELSEIDATLLEAINSSNLMVDEIMSVARKFFSDEEVLSETMIWLAKATKNGWVARYRDGTYGPVV